MNTESLSKIKSEASLQIFRFSLGCWVERKLAVYSILSFLSSVTNPNDRFIIPLVSNSIKSRRNVDTELSTSCCSLCICIEGLLLRISNR